MSSFCIFDFCVLGRVSIVCKGNTITLCAFMPEDKKASILIYFGPNTSSFLKVIETSLRQQSTKHQMVHEQRDVLIHEQQPNHVEVVQPCVVEVTPECVALYSITFVMPELPDDELIPDSPLHDIAVSIKVEHYQSQPFPLQYKQ